MLSSCLSVPGVHSARLGGLQGELEGMGWSDGAGFTLEVMGWRDGAGFTPGGDGVEGWGWIYPGDDGVEGRGWIYPGGARGDGMKGTGLDLLWR